MSKSRISLILCCALLPEAALPAIAATRRALLIGINRYNPPNGLISTGPPKTSPSRKGLSSGDVRHWKYDNLEGAVGDVSLIEGVLLSAFDFRPGDIVKLITPETTTADQILAALRRELVDSASGGDIRLVYYAGHGNYIRNLALKRKNPNILNPFDQTIVPSDHWQGAVDIRDKEISRILWDSSQKGVTVTFIADSCHSGSLTRGPANPRGRNRSNSGVYGVSFSEPVVDDPPTVDPKKNRDINPEQAGVLTLAAAQENEEAQEIWAANNEEHGGMTLALVKAIGEEGPHASMDRIFETMSNYMRASDLSQTPVLAGAGRGARDLLGQTARQDAFSVLVEKAAGGEALLRAGEAIGLYEGSELRRIGAGTATPPVTLVVTKVLGMAEAAAKIDPKAAVVAPGDRFEVTKWAAPSEPNLRVYIAPAAPEETIAQQAERLAPLLRDSSIHWVEDPTEQNPTAILRWAGGRWLLDDIGKAVKTSDLGSGPTASEVKHALPAGASFYALMPPSQALIAAIGLGEGTSHPGIQRLADSDSARADYRLYGRLTGAGLAYAWVQADADLGSRKIPLVVTSRVSAAAPPPLPKRTDWFAGKPDTIASALTEYAIRIGRVRAWLTLSGRPGESQFPYRLVLRKPGSSLSLRSGVLYGGEEYKLYVERDPKFTGPATRRWVYVFAINQKGEGKLLFPYNGNEGNHLPRARREEDKLAAAPPLIDLQEVPVTIQAPWGTDTYILISTIDPILNLNVFNFAGAQSRGAAERGASPLQDLLDDCGDSSRGAISEQAPSDWSIERLTFRSVEERGKAPARR